jgi:hypothetical protein
MVVKVQMTDKMFDEEKTNAIEDFMKFLNKHLTLEKDVHLKFTSKKEGSMTTGQDKPRVMKVLAKNRMFIDVLRTLAHEWVHEYQHQIKHEKSTRDIGGPHENDANAKSGELLKLFVRYYPKYKNILYN